MIEINCIVNNKKQKTPIKDHLNHTLSFSILLPKQDESLLKVKQVYQYIQHSLSKVLNTLPQCVHIFFQSILLKSVSFNNKLYLFSIILLFILPTKHTWLKTKIFSIIPLFYAFTSIFPTKTNINIDSWFFFLSNSIWFFQKKKKNYWLELLREFFLVGFGTIQLHL